MFGSPISVWVQSEPKVPAGGGGGGRRITGQLLKHYFSQLLASSGTNLHFSHSFLMVLEPSPLVLKWDIVSNLERNNHSISPLSNWIRNPGNRRFWFHCLLMLPHPLAWHFPPAIP